jgi:hypothetical protein
MSSSSSGAPPCIGITAFRTGEYFGAQVPESIRAGGDPLKYVVLTNNDRDRQLTGFAKDFTSSQAGTGGGDDDLAKLTLRNCHPTPTQGVIRIELSNPSAVRLFRNDGNPLGSMEVNLASPGGDLAGLATTGTVDVWLEGVLTDQNFVFNLIYLSPAQVELRRDTVHMLLAEMTLRDSSDAEIDFVGAYPLETLLLKADALSAPPHPLTSHVKTFYRYRDDPIPSADVFYKIKIEALPSSAVSQLKVTSDDVPSDYYFDSLVPSTLRSQSSRFGVVHWAKTSATLTSADRTAITNNLTLSTVHGKSATISLITSNDYFKRSLPGVQITVAGSDREPIGGRVLLV